MHFAGLSAKKAVPASCRPIIDPIGDPLAEQHKGAEKKKFGAVLGFPALVTGVSWLTHL